MSPLARALIALACAALLRASSGGVKFRMRTEHDNNIHVPCTAHKLGIIDETDPNFEKSQFNYRILPQNNSVDFLVPMPELPVNQTGQRKALVGQDLMVCDVSRHSTQVVLKQPIVGKHNPIWVHCEGGCTNGVEVFVDLYYIEILD